MCKAPCLNPPRPGRRRLGLLAAKRSRTKGDDKNDHDCQKPLQFPDRPSPRRRPRLGIEAVLPD
jgi:hypothetical protein